MRKFVSILMASVLAAVLLVGCAGDIVPEGAEYGMFSGTMSSEEPGTITEIHGATLKALENLELPVSYDKKDNLVAVVQTFTAEGQSIRITISYMFGDVSELSFTSDDRIDKYKLAGLLDEIRKSMTLL